MDNEYIKPRNKVIRGYDKLSLIGQLIAEAEYMDKRVKAREERSKIKYKDIIRNLMWYYWDLGLLEDEEIDKKYYRLYKIANAKFYKNNFKRGNEVK